MRNSTLEIQAGPSYLLHPENRRIQYAGGFRMIKPQALQDTGTQSNQKPIKKDSIRQVPQPSIRININPEQINTLSKKPQFGYQYYHGDQNFSNFFGLEQNKYDLSFNHHPDCKICNECQQTNIKPQNHKTYPTNNIKVQPKINIRPSSAYSKNSNKDQKPPIITKQQRPQSANRSSKPITPKPKQDSVYQYIQQPLPPKNPTVQQQNEYQHKYKQYLLRKRDLYYLSILKKLIDKIDFQRYQCTSPNGQRVHAHWFGIYKPRTMQTTSGVVKYQLDYHPGYEFLKSFIFVYLQQDKYKQKQSYETNAQMFLNDLQDLLIQTQKSQPTKALQKLNAQAYKRILQGKINKQKIKIFFNRLQFILLALNVNNLNQILNKLPSQLTIEEYKKIFTIKISNKPQNNDLKEYIEKKNSSNNKQTSKQIFNYKPIFPQIQSLEHTGTITQSIVNKQGKKLSIRQKKLLADLIQKQMQQRSHINYKFKAKQIPKDVKDRSLYNKLLDSQAQKSAKNRQQSAKVLLQNQNPFSFYYRDLHKQTPVQQFKQYQSFKAKSIPKHVTQPRYQQLLQEKQKLKKQHLQKRQNQLLRSSKFPATMSYLEDYKQISKPKKQQLPYTFKPNVSGGQIPNFKQLHQKNLNQLEEKKQINRSITTPQQFNLSKGIKRKQPEQQLHLVEKKKPKISQSVQKQYMSGSTLKFNALIEQRKKENEQRQLKQAQRQKELNQKPTKHQQLLKSRIKQTIKFDGPSAGSFVIPDSKWKQQDKQQMLHKVYEQRPLLIDRKYTRIDGQKVQIQNKK